MKLSQKQLEKLQGMIQTLSQLRDRIAQLEIEKSMVLAQHARAGMEYDQFQAQLADLFGLKGKATIDWATGEVTEVVEEKVEVPTEKKAVKKITKGKEVQDATN